MAGNKAVKLVLDSFGSYLGMQKGCLVVKNKKGDVEKYPLFENDIGEVQLRSGNSVSVGALVTLGFWGLDCLLLTGRGHPIAMVKSLEDDSHVKTRISQYEATKNGKGTEIAKTVVLAKIEGQDKVLKKYGLRRLDYSVFEAVKKLECEDDRTFRRRLTGIEGKCSRKYFSQIFGLFRDSLRPNSRRGFKAYDGINNMFNFAYTVLFWKVHIALVKARLEPYLGFLHTVKYGQPSLVCDFEELYRYLVDDYVIRCSLKLKPKDFVLKKDSVGDRKGKRAFLSGKKDKAFTEGLNKLFMSFVEVPRIRVGKRQELETLIGEEALLFARYLRSQKYRWKPRIPSLS